MFYTLKQKLLFTILFVDMTLFVSFKILSFGLHDVIHMDKRCHNNMFCCLSSLFFIQNHQDDETISNLKLMSSLWYMMKIFFNLNFISGHPFATRSKAIYAC